jgi:hypothetical protein
MVDEDGAGAVLSLEEVQALGSVEEATPIMISDSRILILPPVGTQSRKIEKVSGGQRSALHPGDVGSMTMQTRRNALRSVVQAYGDFEPSLRTGTHPLVMAGSTTRSLPGKPRSMFQEA